MFSTKALSVSLLLALSTTQLTLAQQECVSIQGQIDLEPLNSTPGLSKKYKSVATLPFVKSGRQISEIDLQAECTSNGPQAAPTCTWELDLSYCQPGSPCTFSDRSYRTGSIYAAGTGPAAYTVSGGTGAFEYATGTIDSVFEISSFKLKNVVINMCFTYLRGELFSPTGTLGVCEGDCDTDSNCADGLVCFQRDGFTSVPGCGGRGLKDFDYCVEPLAKGADFNPTGQLGVCEGDCDTDANCADGLVCFQRNGFTPIPGCQGLGYSNMDYCIEPQLSGESFTAPSTKLGVCEGDCDYDSECADGLVCFQRNGFTSVPGCQGSGKKDYDYCIRPMLKGDNFNPTGQLGLCEGDCDSNANCAPGLVCFQRNGFTPVPGCQGSGRNDFDYCVKP